MNINWSTVFFQIINFLIIVWILKKYLFKPVLSSMDNREKTIQNRLKEAMAEKQLAEKEKKKFEEKIKSLEKSKSSIIADAYKKADAEYSTLRKTFNAEMLGKRKAFEEQIITEREFLRNSIRDLAGKTILKTVSDALINLANTDVQTLILNNFIEKLKNKELEKIDELKKFYKKNSSIIISSSFEINQKQQAEILHEFSFLLGVKEVKASFELDPSILCGIEIACQPLLISYGLNTYITALQKNLDDGLAELTKTQKISKNISKE